MGRLEALSALNVDEALAYLAERPHENVYVAWLIGAGRLGTKNDVALWRDDGERIAGACYFGPQLVPCGSHDALDAFAAASKRASSPRMIVGPRAAVERVWSQARVWMPRPSATRASQPYYVLDRTTLALGRDGADVARATVAELDEIAAHSAQMIAGEVGGDPRNANADFRGRTERIIESGWWWRYRTAGALAFMCNVGSEAFGTAQLQGVWTPPALRGHGYATQALGAICDRLLHEYGSLCLYVNDYNSSAIALYERVGFVCVGEFQSILFI